MGNGLAATLWAENDDLALANLNCAFVRGLATGALPLPDFQRYVAQDAYFLEAFARAYALALVHCRTREELPALAELLSGVVKELELHRSYAERWNVDLSACTPHPAALAYTEFLLATATLGSTGETCAAMTPCMRLYAYLGQTLKQENPNATHAYRDWIETYSDPAFEALAKQVEGLLDRTADDTPRIRELYRRAMQLELGFFTAFAAG